MLYRLSYQSKMSQQINFHSKNSIFPLSSKMNEIVEEQVPFFESNSESNSSHDNKLRDNSTVKCVASLQVIDWIISSVCLVVTTLLLVNDYENGAIPTWVFFLILFLGHFLLFVVTIWALAMGIDAVVNLSASSRGQELLRLHWQESNENRIPVLQFAVYHLGWILGLSTAGVVFEIILWLEIDLLVPTYVLLVVPYMVVLISLSNAILCRSTSVIATISWFIGLVLCILYTVRLSEGTLNWFVVLSPAMALFLLWDAVMVSVLVKHCGGMYFLEMYQIECASLYTGSFTLFGLSILCICFYLEGYSFTTAGYSFQKIATILLLLGIPIAFAAFHRVLTEELSATIRRLGSVRPIPLSPTPAGGWDVSSDGSYEEFFLLGEIEVHGRIKNGPGNQRRKSRSGMRRSPSLFWDVFSCTCCATSYAELPSMPPRSSLLTGEDDRPHRNYQTL